VRAQKETNLIRASVFSVRIVKLSKHDKSMCIGRLVVMSHGSACRGVHVIC
jgi:hypothetical protein